MFETGGCVAPFCLLNRVSSQRVRIPLHSNSRVLGFPDHVLNLLIVALLRFVTYLIMNDSRLIL